MLMKTPDHPHTPLAHRARLLLSRLALGALHRLDEEPLPIRAKLDRLVVTVVDDPSGMMRLVGVRGVVTTDSVSPLLDTLDRIESATSLHLDLTEARIVGATTLDVIEHSVDQLELRGVRIRIVGLDPRHPALSSHRPRSVGR
jgi:anti-anti-sigma regulatory factor